MKAVRVLIVEDSPAAREHLRRIISSDPRLTVAGLAASGEEALEMVREVAPDVISMDVRLPGIQGLETTRRIMTERPTPIVVVSGIDREELVLTMEALKAGALAVVQKPVSTTHEQYVTLTNRLCTQLAIMSEVKVIRRQETGPRSGEMRIANWPNRYRGPAGPFKVVAIGTSTGGPNALLQILNGLGPEFTLPVAVVQHMATGFIEGFADWLRTVTPFKTCVIGGPTFLEAKTVYMAPSSGHLVLNGSSAALHDGPPVGSHRPSADALFSSLAHNGGSGSIGVLLTGMGDDGAAGLNELRKAGGYTIAEDESTAVVYGMPAAAVRLGAAQETLPLPGIAPRILELVAGAKGAK